MKCGGLIMKMDVDYNWLQSGASRPLKQPVKSMGGRAIASACSYEPGNLVSFHYHNSTQ
jgi:hypothetical protein